MSEERFRIANYWNKELSWSFWRQCWTKDVESIWKLSNLGAKFLFLPESERHKGVFVETDAVVPVKLFYDDNKCHGMINSAEEIRTLIDDRAAQYTSNGKGLVLGATEILNAKFAYTGKEAANVPYPNFGYRLEHNYMPTLGDYLMSIAVDF